MVDRDLPVLDPTALVDLFGIEDRSVFCKILSSYPIKDGPDTHALADIMANGGAPRDLAHKLKSSARAIGAQRLADLYYRIEQGNLAPSAAAAGVIEQEFSAVASAIEQYCAG